MTLQDLRKPAGTKKNKERSRSGTKEKKCGAPEGAPRASNRNFELEVETGAELQQALLALVRVARIRVRLAQ
jgi:hypothetical protein